MMSARLVDAQEVTSVRDRVVDHVRRLIEDGRLGRGDRLPGERDLAQELGVSRPSVRSGLEALEARRGNIDGGDIGAGPAERRGLAAGSGAEVGNAPAGNIAHETGGESGGGILHPPCAIGEAGQRVDRA